MCFVRQFVLIGLLALVAPLSLRADECSNKNKDDDDKKSIPAPATVAPDWSGSYTARSFGYYRGTDSVDVNAAKKLHLKMSLVDASGNTVNFNVPNLDIVDGHFSGNGKINGLDVTVEGRIDCPAPGTPWKIRFTCNYCDKNGHAGRIIGIKDS